ncbi:helix-turn-helix domain-containing protein [Paenibacillus methanolicus]|uniref:AraC-like DNA-binding protein n=1 Tax=Paenibacillus methanolicus TaxID=582686 RepID=A0A5S5BYG4_9BACL|nr:AraC family transcriptional regulator [Paenibacillus methanolicus]TYP72077.1 AraC-like DNA-binding protein [Paenibacillus methanolicus]
MAYLPILHEKSKQYYWRGSGALSIKTFRNGWAYYNTGRGHYRVEEGTYLLLNRGQEYAITIDWETEVESFCVFFPEGMAEEVLRTCITSSAALLDNPFEQRSPSSFEFVEKTYPTDNAALSPLLQSLRVCSGDDLWVEELMHAILQGLLTIHGQVCHDMRKLPALRASTREELYRRIQTGHEYMSAYFDQEIGLSDIARAACLSPNHFLRNYKLLFGYSPHRFIVERRLREAKKLLLSTNETVTEVCMRVGFQSHGTFTNLFARRFGVSPAVFRKKGDIE